MNVMKKLLIVSLGLGLSGLQLAAQAEEKVLRLYNWADYFAPDTLNAFTRETGIRVIYDVMDSPKTVAELIELTGISERHVKRLLTDHPKLFVAVSGSVTGGRGNPKRWARVARETRYWYEDQDDMEEEELPF